MNCAICYVSHAPHELINGMCLACTAISLTKTQTDLAHMRQLVAEYKVNTMYPVKVNTPASTKDPQEFVAMIDNLIQQRILQQYNTDSVSQKAIVEAIELIKRDMADYLLANVYRQGVYAQPNT